MNNYSSHQHDNIQFSFPRPCIVPIGPKHVIDLRTPGKEESSVIVSFYQCDVHNFKDFYFGQRLKSQKNDYKLAKQYLIYTLHLFQTLYFDIIRTKQCLGYNVYSRVVVFEGILGLGYYIQSNNNPPAFLSEKIEDFLVSHIDKVFEVLTDEQLDSMCDLLNSKALCKVLNYPAYNKTLNELILTNGKVFNQLEVSELADKRIKINKDLLHEFVCNFFKEKRKLIEIHVTAANHEKRQLEGLAKIKDSSQVFNFAHIAKNSFELQSSLFGKFMDSWNKTYK